jgi:hypothetical protein
MVPTLRLRLHLPMPLACPVRPTYPLQRIVLQHADNVVGNVLVQAVEHCVNHALDLLQVGSGLGGHGSLLALGCWGEVRLEGCGGRGRGSCEMIAGGGGILESKA